MSTPRRKRPRCSAAPVYDLMIPLPQENASIRIPEILQRLAATGFTHAALTHTVVGIPRDEVDKAIPTQLWKGGKAKKSSGNAAPQVKVLRRLHAVVETLSDLSHYTKRDTMPNNGDSAPLTLTTTSTDTVAVSKSSAILQEYDLVSLCPRNEAVFQSACQSATASDILVLDYNSRGRLPYKIRPRDVQAAIARKAVFEISYAPAILNRNQRKGLIQTCRMLQNASLGAKPKVILSSGCRSVVLEGETEDAGILALRTPADLINLLQVIMKFDSRLSHEALHTANTFALEQAHARRFGQQSITITGIAVQEDGVVEEEPTKSLKKARVEREKEGNVSKKANNKDAKDTGTFEENNDFISM